MKPMDFYIHDWNDKPVKVNTWQMLQWKHALKLEMAGMSMSSGKKVSTHVRKLLSAPRSYKVAEMQGYISDCLDNVAEQLAEA